MMPEDQTTMESLDPRMQGAIRELQGMIAGCYPTATFEISRNQDEPENVHLRTIVDLDDADEVLDLVGEPLLRLQVDQRIPLHVIAIRSPERILAAMEARDEGAGWRTSRAVPLVGGSELLGH